MYKPKALLVGAGPCNMALLKQFIQNDLKKNDLILAADGGYATLHKLNLKPTLLVGDFDSLGYVPDDQELIRHPVRKDETDTMLAVREAARRGADKMYIFGGTGGRVDHTIANVQVLYTLSLNGIAAYLIGVAETMTIVTNGRLTFSPEANGVVSVFSIKEKSEDVTLKGLSYPLDNATLTNRNPMGVSNEFLRKQARISVVNGSLLVVFHGSPAWITERSDCLIPPQSNFRGFV